MHETSKQAHKDNLFCAAELGVQCQPFRKQEQSHQGTRSRVATKHNKRCALFIARIESQVHRPELKRISCWFQASGPPVHHRNGHPGNRSRGALREKTQCTMTAESPVDFILFSTGNSSRCASCSPPALTPPVMSSPVTATTAIILPPVAVG